jgi:hypothetical protein
VTATRKKTGYYFVGLVAALLMTVLMCMASVALTAPPAHAQQGYEYGPYATQQEQSNGGDDDLIGGTQLEQSKGWLPHWMYPRQ